MNEVRNILEQLRKAKTILLILLFVSFILFYYKSLITEVVESKVKKDDLKEDITNGVLIHQMLNDLMLTYKSDRAYIFQFTNTIKYFDGHHRNYQHMTYEVCANGVSSECQNLQNIPTSLTPLFLQDVMLDKMIYRDIDSLQETSTRIELKKQGIKSIVIAPYFKDNKFVAYVGLDYVKEPYNGKFDYRKFKARTNEIGFILTQ